MSVLTSKPLFLYPHSRQFLFDEVSEKIVRALEKRNWQVPDVTVEFDTYGSGEAIYQYVNSITGNDFKLCFSRIQGQLDSVSYDKAALSSIYLPEQILEVTPKHTFNFLLYVGKNWEQDKEWWFSKTSKIHAKLNKQPRKYLRYDGNKYTNELIFDNDLNSEYSPEENEPRCFNLGKKIIKFTNSLELILDYILSFREADIVKPPKTLEPIPYKGPWETIFSICNWRDAERIMLGKENPNKLLPEERHAYSYFRGHRLVPLNIQQNGNIPKVSYEKFIWCDTNEDNHTAPNTKFQYEVICHMYSCFDTNYMVAIKLKYANQVYVVDNFEYKKERERIFNDIAPRKMLTDTEISAVLSKRSATIIPINEYRGNYREPIILIQRELDFDEIKWLTELKH